MILVLITPLAFAMAQLPPSAAAPGVDPAARGPTVGQPIPPFEAQDQDGRLRQFASLAGPKGLVLVFFRSADW